MRPPLPAVRLLNETFEARRLQSARRQQLCMRGRGNFIMYYMFCRDFYLLPLPLPLCRLICAASVARLCAIYRPGYTARGWDIPPLRRLFLQVRPRPRKILPRRSKNCRRRAPNRQNTACAELLRYRLRRSPARGSRKRAKFAPQSAPSSLCKNAALPI